MNNVFAVGWRQVFVCFTLLSATGMISTTYSIIAVPLSEAFEPSRMVLMLSMTVLSGACALFSPLLGSLMDRFPVRRLMIVGGCSLGLGYAAIAFAQTFNHVLIVFGVLIAPANVLLGPVAATVLLSRWFVGKRGRAIGIAILGMSAGIFFFPHIIQGLLNTFEWREAFLWLGLVMFLWTVPVTFLVINHPSDRGLYPDGVQQPEKVAESESSAQPVSALKILGDPMFWMIAATVAVVTSGLKGMITNLVPMAMDSGITASEAAPLVSVYAAGGFIGKFSFAMLSDRIGPRPLMFTSLFGFAMGIACLTQAGSGWSVIALGVFVAGLFGGMMMPMESYLAPRIFGQRAVGKAMGLLSGVVLIALLSSPPLYGLVFDLTGNYQGILWLYAGMALLALFLVPLLRLHPR